MGDVLPRAARAAVDFVHGLDSGPAATTLDELIHGPPSDPAHELMHPSYAAWGVALYLIGKLLLNSLCEAAGTRGKSLPFRLFALVHNCLLCAFSGITAFRTWEITVVHARSHGVEAAYCADGGLWAAGLGYWGFLFYLSKYWELIDTGLLIVKRREPSYLQVYHHAMTIVCAYLLQSSHAPVSFLFVGLNAGVHTVMYAYYALSVVGIRLPGKSAITTLQLAQFVGGIMAAVPIFWLRGGTCATEAQKVAVGGIILHAAYLTYLFVQFYRETYGKKQKAS